MAWHERANTLPMRVLAMATYIVHCTYYRYLYEYTDYRIPINVTLLLLFRLMAQFGVP